MEERRCEQCGKPLLPDTRSRYCPECRAKRRKEALKRSKAKQEKKMQQMIQICTACGQEFRAKSKCVYCPDCRKTRKTVRDRITLEELPRGQMEGAWRREDGVLVLPPVESVAPRRRPKKPPKGTKPSSLEAVLYRLDVENERRAQKGQKPLSYGRFVAMEEMERHRES